MNFPEPSKRARPAMLTRLQQIELWAWYCARRELGNYKTKGRELGLSEEVVYRIVHRLRKRAQKLAEDIARGLAQKPTRKRSQQRATDRTQNRTPDRA